MDNKSTSSLFQTDPNTDNEIIDISLSAIQKKRFRINGDNSKILELNVSDLNLTSRLNVAYSKLVSLMDEVQDTLGSEPAIESDTVTPEQTEKVLEELHRLDEKMREQIDYIFDSNVSEVCAGAGSMWDPIDGALRYEHIISGLLELYENNYSSEFDKLKRRVAGKAAKHRAAVSKYHR